MPHLDTPKGMGRGVPYTADYGVGRGTSYMGSAVSLKEHMMARDCLQNGVYLLPSLQWRRRMTGALGRIDTRGPSTFGLSKRNYTLVIRGHGRVHLM